MTELKKQINEALDYIYKKTPLKPETGIILGTGLGALVKDIKIEEEIPFEDIPHFPVSTVKFHSGKFILGRMGEKNVVVMQGRYHFYEGYTMQQICFPVRVMKMMGAEYLFLSNACGGLNPEYNKGDIVLITDHINLMGTNPLIGPNDDSLGPRFPDMSEPYNRNLINLFQKTAETLKIPVQQGVYAAMTGPCLETAAEYRMLQRIGADVVGMSTVPENIVAVHMGMKVCGLSVVTDICLPDSLEPINVKEVIKIAGNTEPLLASLIKESIKKL